MLVATSTMPLIRVTSFRVLASPISTCLLRPHVAYRPTPPARPRLPIGLEPQHRLLELRPQVRAMEARLVHQLTAVLTVPAQPVDGACRPRLLQHNADRVLEADGIVRRIRWKQEHLLLVNVDVTEAELRIDDLVCLVRMRGRREGGGMDLQQHSPLVLIEPLWRLVDMVVSSGVRPADDLAGVSNLADFCFRLWNNTMTVM